MKLIAASLFVALVLLVACSSGALTLEDYNKLKVGMQVSEAESILGLKLEGVKETTYLGLPLTTEDSVRLMDHTSTSSSKMGRFVS